MRLFKILLFIIIANQAESLFFGKIISILRNKKIVGVSTKNGKVYGYRHDNPTDTPLVKFWAFLGVPYAKPPLFQRRFKDPDTNLLKIPRYAIYSKPGCVTGIGQNVLGKEDCLYLNIFSPVNPDPTMLRAVVVWFHGGAFFAGTGNVPLPYTYSFLESGIILVSVHYRLGVFGFLCTQDSASPGNYGIKDQIAALKWIKTNIRNFGGDPNRITIFGESAGAASVHYILQAKQAKNLFNYAISNSGSSLSPWALNDNPKAVAYQIAQFASIKLYRNTTTELIRRLRWMGYRKLQEASGKFDLLLEHNWNGLVWAPCKEDESSPNAVVTGNSYERLKNGDFNQVPLLTGFNSNEMRVIFAPNPIVNISSSYFMQNINNLVPWDMNYNSNNLNTIANSISYYYFGSNTTATNSKFSQYASDNMFVRSIHKTAQLMAAYSPVYLYRHSYTGGVEYQNFSIEGLGHGGELEFIFNIPQNTKEANLTAKRTSRLWTNFAKYGNPTPNKEIDPLLGILWPKVSQTGNVSYMNIDSNLTIGINPESDSMQFWDRLYNTYGKQPFGTYK